MAMVVNFIGGPVIGGIDLNAGFRFVFGQMWVNTSGT